MNPLTWHRNSQWFDACPASSSAFVLCTSYRFQTYPNTSSSPTQRCPQLLWLYARGSLCLSCIPRAPHLLAAFFFILQGPLLLPPTPWSALHPVGTQAGTLFLHSLAEILLFECQHPARCIAYGLYTVKSFGWIRNEIEHSGSFL